MVVIRSFKETNVNLSEKENNYASALDVYVPEAPRDQSGLLSREALKRKSISSLKEISDDAEDSYYLNQVATSGSTFIRHNFDASLNQPRSIVWRLLRKSRTIELDPVDFNSNVSLQFRKIRIHSPTHINDHCIAISEDSDHFVIDFITKSGYLHTLSFSFLEFVSKDHENITDEPTGLTEDNFRNWRNIALPFPFDIKKPHLIHALSSQKLVVSIIDGSLVLLERQSPLSQISSYVFADTAGTYGLSRILPWRNNDKVPGHPGLLAKTVISIASVPEAELLITISINNSLKVWSLKDITFIEEHHLDTVNNNDNAKNFRQLGPSPLNLLKVTAWNSRYSEIRSCFLTTLLPYGDGIFQAWQVNFDFTRDSGVLTNLGEEYSIIPKIPDSFSTWLVNDFKVIESDNDLLLAILWKSNTSSAFYQVSLPHKSADSDPLWHLSCEVEDSDAQYFHAENSQDDVNKFYLNKIFGPNGYTPKTIETALSIYGSHYAVTLPSNQLVDGEQTLEDKVCQTVGTALTISYTNDSNLDYSTYKNDLAKEWARFDRLNSELQRHGNEALSLEWDSSLGIYLIVKSSFVSIVRPALPVELCYYNKSMKPNERIINKLSNSFLGVEHEAIDRVLRFTKIIYNFRKNLSHSHFNEVLSVITEQTTFSTHSDLKEKMNDLFSGVFKFYFTEELLEKLCQELKSIGDLSEPINFLFKGAVTNFVKIDRNDNAYLTDFGANTLSNTLNDFLITSKLFASDVLLVSLALTYSNFSKRILFFEKFASLFQSIKGLFDVLNLRVKSHVFSHDEFSVIDSVSTPRLENSFSFFNTVISSADNYRLSTQLSSTGFANAIQEIWRYRDITAWNRLSPLFITQLLSHDFIVQAQEMSKYLPDNSLANFLRANIFLRSHESFKARSLFRKIAAEMSENSLASSDLQIVESLRVPSYSSSTFGQGQITYFLGVCKAAVQAGLYSTALLIAKDALEFLTLGDGLEDQNILQIHYSVYKIMFDTAIKARVYDDAYFALVELDRLHLREEKLDNSRRDLPISIREKKTSRYIGKLAMEMIQNGDLSKFNQFGFEGLITLVDEFFFLQANQALARSLLSSSNLQAFSDEINPLIYYKALYSWSIEHNNFREGMFSNFLIFTMLVTNLFFFFFLAATALYMKIQHLETLLFSTSSFLSVQEEIIQNFTIVINTLYCLPPRDRWITVNKLKNTRPITTHNVIKKKAKTNNISSLESIKRCVLTLADLQAEQKVYTDRKQKEIGKKLHFKGF